MNKASFSVRPMQAGEEVPVCELINRVFQAFIAPEFSPEGVREFLEYVDPRCLAERSRANHFVLVAAAQGQVVGVIEIRNHGHVSLFFVDDRYLGRGIGRQLWRRALAICRRARPALTEISVNSSLYAVPVYAGLGFRQKAPEQVVNGVRFVPMVLELGPLPGPD